MAELEEGGRIGNIFIEKVDAHKSAHGLAVVQGIFQHLVRQRKPTLQQIHPQHDLNAFGGTSMLAFWVKGDNEFSPFLPGDNCFHLIEKHFPASPSLLVLELDIPKGLLSTHPEPPSTFLCSLYPFRGYIEGVINQWFPRLAWSALVGGSHGVVLFGTICTGIQSTMDRVCDAGRTEAADFVRTGLSQGRAIAARRLLWNWATGTAVPAGGVCRGWPGQLGAHAGPCARQLCFVRILWRGVLCPG